MRSAGNARRSAKAVDVSGAGELDATMARFQFVCKVSGELWQSSEFFEMKSKEAPRPVEKPSGFVPPVGPRSPGSSRELPLVRLAARLVIVGFVLLVIWVLWGLATHGPSQLPTADPD